MRRPFFGVGAASRSGGVIAGAGGGVGVVVGIGMSAASCGAPAAARVSGFGVPTMAPPQLPSLAELRRGATTRLRRCAPISPARRPPAKATIPRPLGRGGRADRPRRRLGLLK